MIIDNKDKKYNKSSVFLLPMLGLHIRNFVDFYNVYYKTIYDSEKRIYLVYDNIEEPKNYNLFKQNKNYLKDYNVDGFRVIVFRIPEDYLNDFSLFCEGKYNSFSKRYKSLLLRTYNIKKCDLVKIINPSDIDRLELAKSFNVNVDNIDEIFPIPDEIEETFNIGNNYKLEI